MSLQTVLKAPVLDTSMDRVVVVDNLPKAPAEKIEKLQRVLVKIMSMIGPLLDTPTAVFLPTNEDGSTKGFGFFEYSTVELAQEAVKRMDNYVLGNEAPFKVYPFALFEQLSTVPETFVPPPIKPYSEREDLLGHLQDPLYIKGGDQYMLQHGEETSIYWNKPTEPGRPELALKRVRFSEKYSKWSSQGQFLATLHTQGVMLWGGKPIDRAPKLKLPHQNVEQADFSPADRYLFTRSEPSSTDAYPVVLWDIKAGRALRRFAAPTDGSCPAQCPFHWTADDRFFVCMSQTVPGQLEVYELPEKVNAPVLISASGRSGVTCFVVSPKDPVVACFVPEVDNMAAKVVLIDLVTKKEIRQQNLFNAVECELFWHPSGNLLCAKAKIASKKLKKPSATFIVFNMKETGIPIDITELPDTVVPLFQWEPQGTRFAVVSYEAPLLRPPGGYVPPPQLKGTVTFYDAGTKKLALVKTLEAKRQVTALSWSPMGNVLLMADFKSVNGQLEFFDANHMVTLSTKEHFSATVIEWDPTGRYVAVITTALKTPSAECGFMLFTWFGALVQRARKEKFTRFNWRPRPPCVLPEQEQVEMKKNISKIRQEFADEELTEVEQVQKAAKQKRKDVEEAFDQLLQSALSQYQSETEKRRALRNDGYNSDSEDNFIRCPVVIKKTVISTKQEHVFN